jgi:hypothetical protein
MTTTRTALRRRDLPDVFGTIHSPVGVRNEEFARGHARPVLDGVLAELAELGATVPPRVREILALADDVRTKLSASRSASSWLDDVDLATASADDLVTALRAHALAMAAGDATGVHGQELLDGLTERAVDELARHLESMITELRPTFDEAARVLQVAAAAGITPRTTAADVVESDDLIEHWRALGPAVATLDRIEHAAVHATFVCGFEMGVNDQARRGRDAWLAATGVEPVTLTLPSERIAPSFAARPVPGRRPPVAEAINRQITQARVSA